MNQETHAPLKVVHSSKFEANGLPAPAEVGFFVADLQTHRVEQGPFAERRNAEKALNRLRYVRGLALQGTKSDQAELRAAVDAALHSEGMKLSTLIVRQAEPVGRGSRRHVRVWAYSNSGAYSGLGYEMALVGVVVHIDENGIRAEISPSLSDHYRDEWEGSSRHSGH